jgi:flagellar hook-length control protein FliK
VLLEPAVQDAQAAAAPDGHPRAEQAPQSRAETSLPLPTDARIAGGHQSDAQGGGAGGQDRLQELLVRLGGDGTTRTPAGENFRSLLQGAEAGTTAGNTAALTYAQAGAAGTARDTAVPSLPVHTPLRHPEWSDEVSQRIRWAIGNQVQSAELKINPPQLGPVEVRVSVDADRQMTVTLSSHHALVRETLTDNLPRLRDLMSEHGFSAVNVDVSQQSSPDDRQASTRMDADPAPRADAQADADREAEAGATTRSTVSGLVDLYA